MCLQQWKQADQIVPGTVDHAVIVEPLSATAFDHRDYRETFAVTAGSLSKHSFVHDVNEMPEILGSLFPS